MLAAESLDLDALIETTPTIIGRAPRLEFTVALPVALTSIDSNIEHGIAVRGRIHNLSGDPRATRHQRIGQRRWKSPNGHGMAGLVLLPDGKAFCHNQSDELGDGKAHDAFDLYRVLDHGGDHRRAVKAVAEVLRMTNARDAG